jgi:histidinol-phosphate aminotransferase
MSPAPCLHAGAAALGARMGQAEHERMPVSAEPEGRRGHPPRGRAPTAPRSGSTPNPTSAALRAAVARMHGVGAAGVCIGNGSDDILNLLVRCFCGPGAAAGFTLPSYSLYPVLVGHPGRRRGPHRARPHMRLPVERSRPRGPHLLPHLAERADGRRLPEFGDRAGPRFLRRPPRGRRGLRPLRPGERGRPRSPEIREPVVVRTLSKAYALAGIRVGYALADPR